MMFNRKRHVWTSYMLLTHCYFFPSQHTGAAAGERFLLSPEAGGALQCKSVGKMLKLY